MSEPTGGYSVSPDTKKLLNQVLAVGAGVLLFTLFAWIVLPGIRRESAEPKARPGEQAPTAPSAGWLDASEAPAQKAVEIVPLDPKEVLEPTPALLERGKALYSQNCASCHGYSGQADGLAAAALNPKPRNFTVVEGWKNGSTKAGIYKTLQAGLPGTGMVAYDFLPPKDRMALVHTVRGFGKSALPPEDPAALEALSATLASKGGKIPARIPVTDAIAKLAAEAPPAAPLDLAKPGLSEEASALLGRAVSDSQRAAQCLAGIEGWRDDAQKLARAISAGTPHNGFQPAVATLTAGEWQALQSALAFAAAH